LHEAGTTTTPVCAYIAWAAPHADQAEQHTPRRRGEARLADFGLARVAKQRAGTDATVASVSAVCGTAAFLDPI